MHLKYLQSSHHITLCIFYNVPIIYTLKSKQSNGRWKWGGLGRTFARIRLSAGETRWVISYSVHIERVTFTLMLIHWKFSYIRSQDQMWNFLCLEYCGSNSCFESSMKIKIQFWFSWCKQYIFPNSLLCLPCSCPLLNIYGWLFFHETMKNKNFNLWQVN